jgi:hypothetical protein
MKPPLAVLSALVCRGVFTAHSGQADDEADAPPEGVEVQTQGPVHKAYAEAAEMRRAPRHRGGP